MEPTGRAHRAPRRTLVVTNDFPPRHGGIQSFVASMTGLLEEASPGSVVVHTSRQVGDREHDAARDHPVVRDPARVLLPTPAVAARVAASARHHGCDAAWFAAAAPLGLLAPALRRAGVRRTVASTMGHEVWWAGVPGTRSALRAIAERNDVLTHLTDHTAAGISRGLTPAQGAAMVQLLPGVDHRAFAPGAAADAGRALVRARHGLGERPVVVCVSRLVARKGQDVLVRAWPAVRAAVPGAALLLVGEGSHRSTLERLVERLRLDGDVVLAGRAGDDELAAHYAAADLFAMPCRDRMGGLETEGLGICYLEAAASGLAVVAGAAGGAPEAVEDGVSGVVVDGRDAGAVAEVITGLLRDPSRATAMGARGRELAATRWSDRHQAEVLAELLHG